jgi:hypothetical protein
MLIRREDAGVARIFKVISTTILNICGIDGQLHLELVLSSFIVELMPDICGK